MANPQLENGHIKIANEIVDKFCSYRLSGEEWLVLWFILRKTYGWNKKEDKISLSQFAVSTNLKRPSVIRAIKKLVTKKLLLCNQKATSFGNEYKFNKDFDQWSAVTKQLPRGYRVVTKKLTGGNQIANEVVTKKLHTKDTLTKDTNTKYINTLQASPAMEVIPDLLKNKQKHIQIIGLWARAKQITFTGKLHQNSFIRRNLRAAQNLAPYEISRIIEVMAYLINNADFKSTLESVGKYIDDDLTAIGKKQIINLDNYK